MTHDVRVGISIPQNLPYEQLIKRVQFVDNLGFDSLWLSDHYGSSINPKSLWYDGWTLLSAIATMTSNIRIGLMVTSPTQHNPAMVAKWAMTVDHISNGRLELAIGAGGGSATWEEQMIGVKSDWTNAQRVERFREFVEVVDLLLQNPTSSYEGDYYRVKDAAMTAPIQQPRPPLTLAALGKKSIKVAAQYADSWNTLGKGFVSSQDTFDAAKHQMQLLDQYCEEIGRDPKAIRRSFYPFGNLPYGVSVQAFQDFIAPYREIGFSEFIITWLPDNMPNVDQSLLMTRQTLEKIAIEALPKLRT